MPQQFQFPVYSESKAMTDALGNISAIQKLQSNVDATNKANLMAKLQSESTSLSDYGNKLQEHGMIIEAADVFGKAVDQQAKDLQVHEKVMTMLKQSTATVHNDQSYQNWRYRAIKLGAASESDLPTKYDKEAKDLINRISLGTGEYLKYINGQGKNLTALQKNAPLVMKAYGITYNEAVQKLTQSKNKGPLSYFQDMQKAFITSQSYGTEEAAKQAEIATRNVFPDFKRPGSEGVKNYNPATGKAE